MFDIQIDAATRRDHRAPNGLTCGRGRPGRGPAALQEVITSLGAAPGPPSAGRLPGSHGLPGRSRGRRAADRHRPHRGLPALRHGHRHGGAALDLGDGVSLADDPDFGEVLAALPEGRHLTGFMGMDLPQADDGVAGRPRWPSRANCPCPPASTPPRPWPGPGLSAWRPPCWTRASGSRWSPWARPPTACPSANRRPATCPTAARRRHRLRRHRRLRCRRRLGLPHGDPGADARSRRASPSIEDSLGLIGRHARHRPRRGPHRSTHRRGRGRAAARHCRQPGRAGPG